MRSGRPKMMSYRMNSMASMPKSSLFSGNSSLFGAATAPATSTQAPSTQVPTTHAPITQAPTTHAPTTSQTATTQAATTTTTTSSTTPGPLKMSSYLALTNKQEVNGKWTLTSVKDFIAADHLKSIQLLSGNPDDVATVTVIVMLQEQFGHEKLDWSASADKAWEATTFESRMSAMNLVRQIISVFGYSSSVFDVVA